MRTRYDLAMGEEKKTTRNKHELRNRAKASLEQEARILDEVLSEAATWWRSHCSALETSG